MSQMIYRDGKKMVCHNEQRQMPDEMSWLRVNEKKYTQEMQMLVEGNKGCICTFQ